MFLHKFMSRHFFDIRVWAKGRDISKGKSSHKLLKEMSEPHSFFILPALLLSCRQSGGHTHCRVNRALGQLQNSVYCGIVQVFLCFNVLGRKQKHYAPEKRTSTTETWIWRTDCFSVFMFYKDFVIQLCQYLSCHLWPFSPNVCVHLHTPTLWVNSIKKQSVLLSKHVIHILLLLLSRKYLVVTLGTIQMSLTLPNFLILFFIISNNPYFVFYIKTQMRFVLIVPSVCSSYVTTIFYPGPGLLPPASFPVLKKSFYF